MKSLRPWLVCAIAIVVVALCKRFPGRVPLIATNPRLATRLVLGEMRSSWHLGLHRTLYVCTKSRVHYNVEQAFLISNLPSFRMAFRSVASGMPLPGVMFHLGDPHYESAVGQVHQFHGLAQTEKDGRTGRTFRILFWRHGYTVHAVGLDAEGKVAAKASGTIATFPRSAMVTASCGVSLEDIVSWLDRESLSELGQVPPLTYDGPAQETQPAGVNNGSSSRRRPRGET